jgi:hypothetical protein
MGVPKALPLLISWLTCVLNEFLLLCANNIVHSALLFHIPLSKFCLEFNHVLLNGIQNFGHDFLEHQSKNILNMKNPAKKVPSLKTLRPIRILDGLGFAQKQDQKVRVSTAK